MTNSTKFQQIDAAIIGVHKCGTTSLMKLLSQHEGIATHVTGQLPGEQLVKLPTMERSNVLDNYFSVSKNTQKILLRDNSLYQNQALLRSLVSVNSELKIIVIIRNPVDRAFSAYIHAKTRKFEIDYDDLDAAIIDWEAGLAKSRAPYLLNYFELGFYHEKITDILSFAQAKNILIINTEKLLREPQVVADSVFVFMGMPTIKIRPVVENRMARLRFSGLSRLLKRDSYIKRLFRRYISTVVRGKVLTTIVKLNRVNNKKAVLTINQRRKIFDIFKTDMSMLERDFGVRFDDSLRSQDGGSDNFIIGKCIF